MKTPLLRSYSAYFPRLISGIRHSKYPVKKDELRDVDMVTKEEVERKKDAIKNNKKRIQDHAEIKQGSGASKSQKTGPMDVSVRRPISFASL